MDVKMKRRLINVVLFAALAAVIYLTCTDPFGEGTRWQILTNISCVVLVVPLIAWAFAENNKEFLGL